VNKLNIKFLQKQNKHFLYLNFIFLFIVQFVFFYLFLSYIPNNIKKIFFCFFAVLVVLSFLYDKFKSFTLLIAGIFAFAFYLVLINWIEVPNIKTQIYSIFYQVIVIFLSILIWIESIFLKRILDKNLEMEQKIRELEKYNEIGVLTFTEFLNKAELIFNSMKRRNEIGQLLIFKINELKTNREVKTSRTVIKILGEVILNSIRRQFDIVGYLNKSTLLILLQNTDSEGSNIVIDRIKKHLANIPNINYDNFIKNIEISVSEVDDFYDFKNIIEKVNSGSESYAIF
jgi:GGDEF domain-containing protein